jgi:putative FmdB family regulatory protein
MPTYLYFCDECKKEFEHQHSITEELQECPQCQAAGLPAHKPQRLISGGTSFILLGGSWAKEGYK